MHVTAAGWAATLGALALLLGFDLIRTGRRPHAVGFREAVISSVFYVAVALLFGVVFGLVAGWGLGAQYFAGYIVEKSLSVDNLFVFLIIMSTFAVPAEQQARALTIGIIAALVLRAAFIAAGAALLEAFSVMFVVFGLALIITAVQLFRHRNEDPSIEDNVLVGGARRLLPLTTEYDGAKLLTRAGDRRVLTPLFLVLVAIGSTDLLFALDSIPAVFGVTQHPYIVFTANAFALLGLRPLFFLVSGLLDRLVYLSTALALILAFIGVKLILHFAHLRAPSVPEIRTGPSLAVIIVLIAVATIASIIKVRSDPTLRAHAGSLHDTHREPNAESDEARR
jgi:tellurite resistance protein TerC